jgi:hypothetical protein
MMDGVSLSKNSAEKPMTREEIIALQKKQRKETIARNAIEMQKQRGIKPSAKQWAIIHQKMNEEANATNLS